MKVCFVTLAVGVLLDLVTADHKQFTKDGLVITFHNEKLNRTAAGEMCKKEGSTLGKIPNQKIQDFVFEKAKELKADDFINSRSLWFGYDCTVDATTEDAKAFWADGEAVEYKNCAESSCWTSFCNSSSNKWMFSVIPCRSKYWLNAGEWFRVSIGYKANFICTHDEQ